MTIGVVAWFDEATEARIRVIWRDLGDLGVPSLATRGLPDARPHVSYLYGDQLDVPAALAELETLAPMPSIDVRLGAVAVFPPRVLHLPVAPTSRLLQRHAEVSAAASRHLGGGRPFHSPGRWNPHVTLARTVPRGLVEDAVDLCARHLPIEGSLESMGIEDADTGETWPVAGRAAT